MPIEKELPELTRMTSHGGRERMLMLADAIDYIATETEHNYRNIARYIREAMEVKSDADE